MADFDSLKSSNEVDLVYFSFPWMELLSEDPVSVTPSIECKDPYSKEVSLECQLVGLKPYGHL